MRDLTTGALLDAVRAWVEIESLTNDAAGVNRAADHAEALLRGIGATIERTRLLARLFETLGPGVAGL
ncbi:hypothetical protein [Roseomonas rosulenta]|uniref:hypothetical protein n=1 Tax=Roseomonas rosulenta TaxID=2748667 RepID=UPI0018E03CAE|nr:hypothetical protein [Roseomonas rosulenta]